MHKIRWRKSFMVSMYIAGACVLAGAVGWQLSQLWLPLALLFWTVLLLGSVCFVWGFLAPCGTVGARLRLYGFRWLGVFTYGFPTLLACWFLCAVCGWDSTGVALAYGIGAVCTAALLVFARIQAQRVRVRTYSVPHKKIETPFRIAFLSDLHFEAHNRFDRLASAITRINEEIKPDLVVLCGDVFYDRVLTGAPADALRAVLSKLKAPHGVYACLGNHDIDEPRSNAYVKVEQFLRDCGIILLLDAAVPMPFGTLIGRKDRHLRERLTPSELMETLSPQGFTLMIDHQPVDIHATAEAGIDLLLCGHTHRGQLLPIPIFHACHLFYGRRQFGALCAIVTCGFGWYGPPLRLGSTGEIGVVDLLPSAEAQMNEKVTQKTLDIPSGM